MKKEKWVFLFYGLGISGGANVIFEHAFYAYKQGVDVYFALTNIEEKDRASWHRGTECFHYLTFAEASNVEFDVAIATEWKSAFDICYINAKKYVYFVQSIESRFYAERDGYLPYVADTSYELNFNYITEASWIQEYLMKKYNKSSTLVLNGIDKRVFTSEGCCIDARKPDKLRFLVEGSVKKWLKNVPKTIELCNKAGVEELWLVTPDDIDDYPGVDRVFSKIPFSDMSKIYRSCDVLVKLSLVEGMFGPPLEMFHCGGTAIVYDIEGADEYIKDNVNALSVSKNNEAEVIAAIKKLINNREKVDELKAEALKTASTWIDWNMSSRKFYDSINTFCEACSEEKEVLLEKAKAGSVAYRQIENLFGRTPENIRISRAVEYVRNTKKRLYIYGAGNYCRSTIMLLASHEIVVDGIVVTSKKDNPESVLCHPVFELHELTNDKDDIVIYISVERYYDEINAYLMDNGFTCII